MKEQFVTYDIALKLKELGFNEECLAMYINLVLKPVIQKPISGEFNYKFKSVRNSVIVNSENCSAPLWQQVIDWLREKHEIFISINYWGKRNVTSNNSVLYPNLFNYSLCQELIPKEKWIEGWYNNYEEAREQAILKALELCKNN